MKAFKSVSDTIAGRGGRGSGSGGGTAKTHKTPKAITSSYQKMNEGKISTEEFKKTVRKNGWHIDMRQADRSPMQISDPSGFSHDLY